MDPGKAPGHHSMSYQADNTVQTYLTCNMLLHMPNMRYGLPACRTYGAALPQRAAQVRQAACFVLQGSCCEEALPSRPDESCRLQACKLCWTWQHKWCLPACNARAVSDPHPECQTCGAGCQHALQKLTTVAGSSSSASSSSSDSSSSSLSSASSTDICWAPWGRL